MSILNRRNAIFGWAVWEAGKRAMSAKAKRSAGVKTRGGRVRAALAGFAVVAGGAWLVRRLTGGGDDSSE
jgi:hypothetical protein